MFYPRFHSLHWIALVAGFSLFQTISPAAAPRDYPRSKTHERRAVASDRKAVPTGLDLTRGAAVDSVAPESKREAGVARRNPARIAARREATPRFSEAVEAARWAAEQTFRVDGRREYFRVGLYRGLQAALDAQGSGYPIDPEGRSRGWHDPQARFEGLEHGFQAAVQLAGERAAAQVEAQFRDLSQEPRKRPDPGGPHYEPHPPLWDAPQLDDLLAEFPLDRFLDAQHVGFVQDWGYDAMRLQNCSTYEEIYRVDWNSPDHAFARWHRDSRRSAAFRRLDIEQDRERFRATFDREFAHRIAALYEGHGKWAHDRGFEEGWSYGRFLIEELAFRRGYDAGFADRFLEASVDGFHRRYSTEYRERYSRVFDEWSDSARPEIEAVRIVDGDADGVFEPGESVRVYYELANYGGRGVELGVEIAGDRIRPEGRARIWVAPRDLTPVETPLEARILESTPTRTRTELALHAAGLTATVPLEVAYPLSIATDGLRVRRNDLDGTLQVDVRVRNASRNPKQAEVRLLVHGTASPVSRSLGRIEGGSSSATVLFVEGLDPLALMAGQTRLEVQAVDGESLQDSRVRDLPETVGDLENHDLLTYMLGLSSDPLTDPRRLNRARQLMLRRLEEDWAAAVRASGNPYKHDFRQGGERTALGELVNAIRASRDLDSFRGIHADVSELVREQRGAHPFLRKYAQRLASRLP